MKPVTLLVAGAGGRRTGYANYALENPDRVKIVGVAEPRDYYREQMAEKHAIPPENVFSDWAGMAAKDKFADGVIIGTQDAMHVEPAVAFAEKGYQMLLEKPMAPDEAGCRTIVDAVKKAGVILAVCHVSRYAPFTQKLKEVLDSGVIGDIVNIQRFEPVGYWHQAHSFVRGNWRNEAESSFMLLAKSCHDIDWLRYMMGVPCKAVASFGSLRHFRKEEQPEGASDRCLDCKVEADCPYSALKIYLRDRLEKGQTGWPTSVLTPDVTVEGVTEALRTGPYGRCVYACDNDVVDHQVVSFWYEGDRSASFTMSAFAKARGRETHILGTKGELFCDGAVIKRFDFLTDETEEIDTTASDSSILGGHGGGDEGIMNAFVQAVAENDPGRILSGPDETLESHITVFRAEQARREGRVVQID